MSNINFNNVSLKVSVLMITYNHGNYILEAINSVLQQKTDFKFEIIICDDNSTDNTAEICQKISVQYPDLIKFHKNKKNLGMQLNFIQAYNMCSGEYIAILEGDDYWCDPNKLQIQANFLDANPGYAITFTDARVYDQTMERIEEATLAGHLTKDTYSQAEIAAVNFIPTLTVLFRKKIAVLPDLIKEAFPVDWPLHILNAEYGDIGYIRIITGVYRKHAGGVCSASSILKNNQRYLTLLDQLKTASHNNKTLLHALSSAKIRILKENSYHEYKEGHYLKSFIHGIRYLCLTAVK